MGRGQRLERAAARGDVQLPEQALHVRAHGVLGDEQAPCDFGRSRDAGRGGAGPRAPAPTRGARSIRGHRRRHHARFGPVRASGARRLPRARPLPRRRRGGSRRGARAAPSSGGSRPRRRELLRRFSSSPEAVKTTTSQFGASARNRGRASSPLDPVSRGRAGSHRAEARARGRLPPVRSLADDVEAVAGEQRGEPVAGQRVVVDEKDARRHPHAYRQADCGLRDTCGATT